MFTAARFFTLRMRIFVAVLSLSVLALATPERAAAADPQSHNPEDPAASARAEWMLTVDPTTLLTWDLDGTVAVRGGAKVPGEHRETVARAVETLNKSLAAGHVTVDDDLAVHITAAGIAWATQEIQSALGDCLAVSGVTASWRGFEVQAEPTCDTTVPPGGATPGSRPAAAAPSAAPSTETAVAAASGVECLLAIIGLALAVTLLVWSAGALFWVLVLSRLTFGVAWLTFPLACANIFAARAQKMNGWGNCRLTFTSSVRKDFNCNSNWWW